MQIQRANNKSHFLAVSSLVTLTIVLFGLAYLLAQQPVPPEKVHTAQEGNDSLLKTPIPTPQSRPTGYYVPIPNLKDAQAVEIRVVLDGNSPIAPVDNNYDLTRVDKNFVGTASFSYGGRETDRRSYTKVVSLPREVVQSFLERLSSTTASQDQYQPRIERTDDYPSIGIRVDTRAGPVYFHTESQGDYHDPWAVDIADKTYVINSPVPGEALDKLQGHLPQWDQYR